MSIFVLKSTCAYLWFFAILSVGCAEDVPRGSETTATLDQHRRIFPRLQLSSCLVPPQPTNGGWQLHPLFCDDGQDCDISESTFVKKGSILIYTCDSGYRVEGNPDVHCVGMRGWTEIPSCIQSVEDDTTTSSSITTTTATSSYPTEEENIDSFDSENSDSKIHQSKSFSRRSRRDASTKAGKIIAQVTVGLGCVGLGVVTAGLATLFAGGACVAAEVALDQIPTD